MEKANRKHDVKLLLAVLLTALMAVMVFGLAACGSSGNSGAASDASSSASQISDDAEASSASESSSASEATPTYDASKCFDKNGSVTAYAIIELNDKERSSLLADNGYYIDGNDKTDEEFYVNEKRSCYVKYYDADGNMLQNNAEYYGITGFEDHRPYFYTICSYDYSDVESAYKGLVSDFVTSLDTNTFEEGNDILAIVEGSSKEQYLILGLKSGNADKPYVFIDIYPEDVLQAGAFFEGKNGLTPTEIFEAYTGRTPNV